jgi:RNA polymerase sigma factor (sigma-70 family)
MDDDAQLLARYVRDGSEAAFTELVRRYLNLVYSAALRQVGGDRHRAEEVAQVVFADLARKASDLSRHSALIGWLYTSTHYAARNLARSERRRRTHEEEAQAMHDILLTEPNADWEHLRPIIDDAMQDLNARERDAVLLRFFDKQSFAEVGAKLGITENAARKTTERAIEKLRDLLARRGVTSTASALAVVMAEQAVVAAPIGMVASVSAAALQSAVIGAGSATSVGIVHFMSATKGVVTIAGLVCVVAIGSAVFQANRARQAEASLAALSSTSKVHVDRARDVQAKPETRESNLNLAGRAEREKAVDGPTPPHQEPGPSRKQKKSTELIQTAKSFGESMKDPEYAAMWRKQQLRTVLKQYGDALAALNLPPEKLAKLKELMVLETEIDEDAKDAARAAGLTGESSQKAVRQARNGVHEEIKALLGDQATTQLAREALAGPHKPRIEDTFAIDLKASGMPLSPEQVTSLALGFRDVIRTFEPKDRLADPPDPRTGLTPLQQALLDRYAQHLTPAQLQVTRTFFIEEAKWGLLNRKK